MKACDGGRKRSEENRILEGEESELRLPFPSSYSHALIQILPGPARMPSHRRSLSRALQTKGTLTCSLFVRNCIRALSLATVFSHISCLTEQEPSLIPAPGLALKMSVEWTITFSLELAIQRRKPKYEQSGGGTKDKREVTSYQQTVDKNTNLKTQGGEIRAEHIST